MLGRLQLWSFVLFASLLAAPALDACKCAYRGPVCRWFPSSSDPAFVGRVIEMEPGSNEDFRTRVESALRPYIGNAIAVHPQTLEGEAFALYVSIYRDFWGSVVPSESLDELSSVTSYGEFVAWQRQYGSQLGRRLVRFAVAEVFAGDVGETIDIYTRAGGPGTCTPSFEIGEEYLVFANRSQDQWSTSTCAGTRRTSRAQEDLEFLRGYASAAPLGSLVGSVTEHDWNLEGYAPGVPAVGAEIEVSNTDRSWKTLTDPDGRFSIGGLQPGQYSIRSQYHGQPVSLGPEGIPETNPVQLVPARGCAFVRFSRPAPSGSITGHVFAPTTEPLPRISVRVVPTDGKSDGRQAQTDQNGRFEIKELQPGGYFVGVNIAGPPTAHRPYATIYYPGAPSQGAAAVLQVADGMSTDAGALRLGRRLHVRKIVGKVVAADGQPLSEVRVQLVPVGAPYGISGYRTSEDGAFELEGLEDSYVARAELRSPRDGSVVTAETVVPSEGDAPITIVLVVP